MEIVKKFIQLEIKHYNRLADDAKKLISSIFLYNIISPFLALFISAFLWRATHAVQVVAVYNIFHFLGLIVGFYLNGLLLRKYIASTLYVLGLLIRGVSIFMLMFVARTDYLAVSFFGLLFGISGGIFWANRNLLTLKTTQSNNRIYFSGIESNTETLMNIVMPICIGWFIIAGEHVHLYSALNAYKYLAIFMLFIIVLIAFTLKKLSIEIPPPATLKLSSVSKRWQRYRIFEFSRGLFSGMVSFVPALMVLILVGKENTLGFIQSLSAIFTMLVVFILIKSLKTKHRLFLFGISSSLGIVSALIFSLTYSAVGVYVFYAALAILTPFSWMATRSLNYDLIDEDKKGNMHYAYVYDQEIYLNAGRIVAILIFLFLSMFSANLAVRYTPLLFACSQLLLLFVVYQLENNKKHNMGEAILKEQDATMLS